MLGPSVSEFTKQLSYEPVFNKLNGVGMKPIIFLDFDDVLAIHQVYNSYRVLEAFSGEKNEVAPELWTSVFDASARKNLLLLHKEFSPNYVISSSWASHLNRDQICEVLRRTSLQFVSENLSDYWCTPRDSASGRLNEIEAWLEQHTSSVGYAYVILDDHVSGWGLSDSWLEDKTVFCDAWVGFTYAKLRTARKILQKQIDD